MAVKIRLARRGRKKLALYDVVVADARAPRDGRFIEKLGTYNPLTNPATVEINDERAFHWIMNGAQPTDTVKSVLSYRGVLLKKHLQIGVLKGAPRIESTSRNQNPTDTVKSMLSYRGVLLKKHLQIGVLKGALTQEQADARLAEWLREKEAKTKKKVEKLAESKAAESKARRDAETRVKEARAEAIRKKSVVPEEPAAAENAGEEQAAAPEAPGAAETGAAES